jgi:dCTP deaminase
VDPAPWNKWIPGVLSKEQLRDLCEKGFIIGEGGDVALDQSAIDLSLSDYAFRMIKGSVKPPGSNAYDWFIQHEKLAERIEPSTEGIFDLQTKQTYIFKLRERLEPSLADGQIFGQATAKSTVGRVDVLARLIVDGMGSYEGFIPSGIRSGDMYLEITPITFNVLVKKGIRLSQLRLFYGDPRHVEMKGQLLFNRVLHGSERPDGSLSVDLTNEDIRGFSAAAFCADSASTQAQSIPLWEEPEDRKPDPCGRWKFIKSDKSTRLTIEKDKFYLLRSKEKISVPPGIAIYCRASDETIGEMRIHYAGFAHPFFGYEREDGAEGTPLIFEVRGHQVDVTLSHAEKMANLTFYRMSVDCTKEKSSYQTQSLQLSKFFKAWPANLKVSSDGTVERA